MYLRNYKGKIVFIDEKKYTSDKELYILIWKTKYNIDISNFLLHILIVCNEG